MRNIHTEDLKTRFQLRINGIDDELVSEYWRTMTASEGWGAFPPIAVAEIGDEYFVVDGHHRLEAAKLAQLPEVPVEVVATDEESAFVESFRRNNTQGLRLSREDREHAIRALLKIFWNHSDNWIASQIGVGNATVGRYRQKIKDDNAVQDLSFSNEKDKNKTDIRVRSDGRTFRVPQKVEIKHDEESLSPPEPKPEEEPTSPLPEVPEEPKRENLSSADVLTLQKDLPVEVIGARLWVFYEGNSKPFKMSELAAFLQDRVLNGGE